MREFLLRLQQRLSLPRGILAGGLVVLFVLCFFVPIELVHSYRVAVVAAWGCLVVMTRESDVFVMRVPVPIPVLIGFVLFTPAVQAWRSFHKSRLRHRE